MGQTKSVQPLLALESRAAGPGKTSGFLVASIDKDASQIYVEITDKGASGVLDIKVQDSWKDEDAKYSDTGDEALGLNATGISRIPPDSVRGKYLRLDYEVKNNAMTFGVFLVKAEVSP